MLLFLRSVFLSITILEHVRERCLLVGGSGATWQEGAGGVLCPRRDRPAWSLGSSRLQGEGAFAGFGSRAGGPWAVRRRRSSKFFYFYIIFYSIYQKYMWLYFFFKNVTLPPVRLALPPDEPAVLSLAHGPWKLPPFDPAVAPYRQTNRR